MSGCPCTCHNGHDYPCDLAGGCHAHHRETKPAVSPVTAVAQDLSAITDMATRLEAQAVARANDRLMPGGPAMVSLAGAAKPSEWEARTEAAERAWLLENWTGWLDDDTPVVSDDVKRPDFWSEADDEWEPPLQTLLFWSEQWRVQHGADYGKRPTIHNEAKFLRWLLDWAWRNEPHFDDFADDIRQARLRMENMLIEGDRAERGVPCLRPECRGVLLARKLRPTRDEAGRKVWRETDWFCPVCRQATTENQYRASVKVAYEAEIERQSVEWVETTDGQREKWCTVEHAASLCWRSVKTVRTWRNRGQVAAATMWLREDRPEYVRWADVKERDELAKERRAALEHSRLRKESHHGSLVPESNGSTWHARTDRQSSPKDDEPLSETVRRMVHPDDYVNPENLRAG